MTRPRHLTAAARGTLVLFLALGLASLLDARGLHKTAEIQPQGLRRQVALALTGALVRVSDTVYLDRPREELKAALGRSGDDQVNTTVAIPAAPRRKQAKAKPVLTPRKRRSQRPSVPARPVFTPSHPLRIWVAGDSLVAVPGQALERAVGSVSALDVITVESRVATGLGRPDVFNWYTRFEAAIHGLRPRVAVLSFGADDGHNYLAGVPAGHAIGPLGSASWDAEYRRRLEGVTREFNDAGIYLVWLGLPIIRGPTQNHSFQTIDKLLRVVAVAHPRTVAFIDTYRMFETPHGRYTDYLRNAHGALVLMRASDGIHYEPPAGDLIARAVLKRLNEVFDLTSWQRRARRH